MTVMSLIGHIASRKFDALTLRKTQPVRSPAPAGLHQGSTVEISQVPLILAQAGGAVFPASDFKTSQTVVSVGDYDFSGFKVYRAYLSDGNSFIEVPANPSNPNDAVHMRLYSLRSEDIVSNPDDRDFLVGAEPVYTTQLVQGQATFDNPTGVYSQQVMVRDRVDGLIGWPSFNVGNDETPELFGRVWQPGENPAAPEEIHETIRDAAGGITSVFHRMMQYSRSVSDVAEFVYADYADTGQGCVFSVYVGLELSVSTIKILASA